MTTPYIGRGARGVSAAALLALWAGPSLAITPDEVWTQWQAYLGGSGYEISASESTSGDTLTIADLTLTMEMPAEDDGEATVTIRLGDFDLIGQGDGSVVIAVPDSQTVRINFDAPEEDPVDVTLEQVNTGLDIVASGTAENTDYTYSAESIGLNVTEIVQDGAPLDLGSLGMTLTALAGTTDIDFADGSYAVTQDVTGEELSYAVDIRNPEPGSDGRFEMSGSMKDLKSTGGGTVPEGADMSDMQAAMEAGYSVEATMGYAEGATDMAFREGDTWFDYASTSQGGSFAFSLDAARLVYQVLASGVTIDASGSDVPFPVSVSAGEVGVQMAMPLAESEEAQPFSAGVTLSEVALPDQVWAMADPAGGLPHDPVTVEVALSGTGRLFVDLTDEAEMTQLAETGGTPGEVETLTLDKLSIKALGAEIGATADLQVDNEAVSPFGSGPNVWGTANVRLTGVQALLNTLSQMGLLPPAQAMMAAGMISQLGKPVSGPDDLEADIDLSEQGELSVNGRPMPLR